MDNNNFQPVFNPGTVADPAQGQNLNPGQNLNQGQTPTPGMNQPSMQPPLPNQAPEVETLKHRTFLWMIITIVAALVAVTFIGLFIWMYTKWDSAQTDVDGQIKAAVAVAEANAIAETERTFEEREKYPYSLFAGPSDYGSLTFEYPKTWSLYEEKDARDNRSDYTAYLNPDKVPPLDSSTPLALRVQILTQSFDSYINNYTSRVANGDLTLTVIAVGGSNANLYRGKFDNNFNGLAAVFKVRDKTVVLRTDAELFEADFMSVLSTVSYNL